jgi:MscS family membrane protein
MTTVQHWLDTYLPGNTLGDLAWFLGILLVGTLGQRLLARSISGWAYRLLVREVGGVPFGEFIRLMRPPIGAWLTLTVVFVAVSQLTVPAIWHWKPTTEPGMLMLIQRGYGTFYVVVLTWAGTRAVRVVSLIFEKRAEQTQARFDSQLVPFVRDLVIAVLIVLGVFTTLGVVFEINVTALIASLGLSGLVVALAARETFENLFASFALLIDGPFLVGDSIKTGTIEGDVERIGIRSTRLRHDDGSLLVVPNRLLVSQSLENLTQRRVRRAQFLLHLDLDTPPDTLQRFLTDCRHLLASHPLTNAEPALVRLDAIGEHALEIRVIFFISTASLRVFREGKDQINFALLGLVQARGIRFGTNVPKLIIRE